MSTAIENCQPPRSALLIWFVRVRWVIGLCAVGVSLVAVATPGLPWGDRWVVLFGVGLTILAHNALLSLTLGRRARMDFMSGEPATMMFIGVGLDLVGLSILTTLTGGASSPLLTFYAAHVVLAATVFKPRLAFVVALSAIIALAVMLLLADSWPETLVSGFILFGWAAALVVVALVSAAVAASFRESERRLVESQRRGEAVLDTAVDGVITIDKAGTILSINRAASRLFGYADGELVGKNVSTLMGEPEHSEHDSYVSTYLQTRVPKIIGFGREVVGRKRTGESIPIELAVSEVHLPDDILFTGIVRDLTAQKLAEAEIIEARRRIDEQNEAIAQQEKLAALGQLAAGVAHEVSNPLASIDGILQLAQRREQSIDSEQIKLIRKQVARMRDVIMEITTFARPAQNTLEPTCLGDVATQTLDLVRFDHRIRHVRVECDLADGRATVLASEHELQQVVLNLLTNALDAIAEIDSPRLNIRTRAEAAECVLEIEDNGPGIPPDDRLRVFDPFYTTKAPGKGTGLGLSISARMVDRFGGQLKHRPTKGGGTTFVLVLPRVDTEGMTLPPSAEREDSRPSLPESKNDEGTNDT